MGHCHRSTLATVVVAVACGYSSTVVDSWTGVPEREKVEFLFSVFDVRPNDGCLGYDELELLQRLTDPQLPLDVATYRHIVALLGGDLWRGLTLAQFNSSYYLHRNRLGTDIHKDYAIVRRVLDRAM